MKKVNGKRKWKSNSNSRFSDEECQPITSNRNDDSEEFQLENLPMNPKVVEKPVLPGDTLQTLALRFNSSVSELKRVNHIIWDNELFARRIIKIPCKLLTADNIDDQLAQVHLKKIQNETDPSNSCTSSTSSISEKEFEKNIESIMNNKAIQKAALKNHQMNLEKGFAKWNAERQPHQLSLKFDDGIVTDAEEEEFDTVDSHLLSDSISPLKAQQSTTVLHPVLQILQLNGSDGGLSWPHLMLCVLCLCLFVPMLYVLYITDVFTFTFTDKDTQNTVVEP